jgi:hypothetical protein
MPTFTELVSIRKSRSGFLIGNELSRRESIKLKIATFAPMPSAKVRTATVVETGLLRSERSA